MSPSWKLGLVLGILGCSGGGHGWGPRTFEEGIHASVDLGDSVGLLLEDRSVVIAPDDASAPLVRLGHVDGAEPGTLVVAGSSLLATSSVGDQDHLAQMFSRTDRSVRGVARGRIWPCARGDAPVIWYLRDDGSFFARLYDPATLAVTAEAGIMGEGEYRGCDGDQWGLVLQVERVVFDAEGASWLASVDRPGAYGRALEVPGELVTWTLHDGALFALVRSHGEQPRLHAIDRAGGPARAIGNPMENAGYLTVGRHHACVTDDAMRAPHHVWRVALDGSATEAVYEGPDRPGCVAVRNDFVVVTDGHTLRRLPE